MMPPSVLVVGRHARHLGSRAYFATAGPTSHSFIGRRLSFWRPAPRQAAASITKLRLYASICPNCGTLLARLNPRADPAIVDAQRGPMTALRSRIESEGERKIIRLAGELDLAVADDVLALGLLALDADNVVELVLDMDDVTFLDSTGIGTLIRIRNAAIARGVELQLRGVGPRIRRVLSITGLENVFDCLP